MMFSDRLSNAFNTQIKNELNSAYIYLGMAAYFDDGNLPGFAHWMRAQAQEELTHAIKFYTFVYERDGSVVLESLEQPKADYESPLAAFQAAYEHEQYISGTIHHLYQLAEEEHDYASRPLLHWFIEEQIEEEANARTVVEQLQMIGESKTGIFMLDRQLGSR
jgi:ferritin